MMNSPNFFSSIFFFFIFCSASSILVESVVPPSKTFESVNQGFLFFGNVESNAQYRPLNISNYPFRLCFYNSTPNAYTLGLGMGNANSTSLMRWVWAANHARPVSENAKLIFGGNGNLVLVDADGRVAWQTRTANKGVVDIKLLPSGNLVLRDKKGGFVWQSFHYPTDTLLIGQSLQQGNLSNKLVSGSYSMVMEEKQVGLFFKSPQSSKPLLYLVESPSLVEGPFKNVTFMVAPAEDGPDYANELRLEFMGTSSGRSILAQPKYDSTLSILRLGSDGNIRIYTYFEKGNKDAWEETYTEFRKNWLSECLLPEKCGSFGLCDDDQCVACPTPKGLMGWNRDCKPSKLPAASCNSTTGASADVSYYKMEGVDHFLNTNFQGEGPMKIGECRKKCTKDCKCMAFFYRKDTSMCLLTAQLNTLMKAIDSSSNERIAYIKYV
ncbi:S-locus glycoprotein [Macleaya cordata]|uniref:S-locus glycoprotein n=1 Tax=Macleaya cordata TaxID=56857 RepID=A0A200QXP0_MACCD|nr:S-locus glycoprotein [Macleaya cordata]